MRKTLHLLAAAAFLCTALPAFAGSGYRSTESLASAPAKMTVDSQPAFVLVASKESFDIALTSAAGQVPKPAYVGGMHVHPLGGASARTPAAAGYMSWRSTPKS